MRTEVMVVGAGPVGLTLAIELARRGIACRVIDRAPGPSPHSRALVIHRRTQELLETAGLLEPIARRSIPVGGMVFAWRGRPVSEVPYGSGSAAALSLPQQETEHVLRAALEGLGVAVEWGVELTGFRASATGVHLQFGNGDSAEARYLAGCDGAHSAVRHLAGIPFAGDSLPETVLMADALVDWDVAPDRVIQFLHPDGAISAIPMPGGAWRLAAMAPAPDMAAGDHFFEAALGRRSGHHPARMQITWTSSFTVRCLLAARLRSGNVFLAGDAAHIHSPVGGQGMNVGMQDAFNLGWKLAAVLRGWREDLLDSYEVERRPVAEAVIRTNARVTRLLMTQNPLRKLVRDRGLPQAMRIPAVARRAGMEASGLGIAYPASPLSGPCGGVRHAWTSGDRSPAPGVEPGAGWTVAPGRAGHLRLVRPDGYLAAELPAEPDGGRRVLASHLRRLGAPADLTATLPALPA